MTAVICRTGSGSIPVPTWNAPSSARISASLPVHESVGSEKNSGCSSPKICLQMEIGRRSIRRVSSMPSVIRSEIELSGGAKSLSRIESRLPAKIPEEEVSTGDFAGGSSDRSSIATYYEQMLRSNPTNALLLRNYGKYLHEEEKDFVKAEEYYGRAILVSPGDGEVLAMYGKLIWETQRDESRARSYFDQAVNASPDDCTVMGSYAHFMWEAEDDEEDEVMVPGALNTMVEAF